MEKVTIRYRKEVTAYLNQLSLILFYRDYFSYLENAIRYKNGIIRFIDHNIFKQPNRQTPKKLKHFGSKYIFYKSNARTTWFIFFEHKGNNYLITHITNNHTEEAKWL